MLYLLTKLSAIPSSGICFVVKAEHLGKKPLIPINNRIPFIRLKAFNLLINRDVSVYKCRISSDDNKVWYFFKYSTVKRYSPPSSFFLLFLLIKCNSDYGNILSSLIYPAKSSCLYVKVYIDIAVFQI